MTHLKSILTGCSVLFFCIQLKANGTPQLKTNDSLTLAQAFVNLSLTEEYFDTLSIERLNKIIQFEESELSSLRDSNLIHQVNYLYNFTYCLLYINKARLLLQTSGDKNRSVLLQLNNTLYTAIDYFNRSNLNHYIFSTQNNYDVFIGFTDDLCEHIKRSIFRLKAKLDPYFNADIYPDFQRIYYAAKDSGHFQFDSLSFYAGMYRLQLSMNILNNTEDNDYPSSTMILRIPSYLKIDASYPLDPSMDLISRYLQLDYIINGGKYATTVKDTATLCGSYWNYLNDLRSYYATGTPDSFFRREVDTVQAKKLYRDLIKKYQLCESEFTNPKHVKMPKAVGSEGPTKYYFPIPAPFPSAYLYINNYKPGLVTMKQVDDYFESLFNKKGYGGHLHYYYVESGFAVTTDLEKINKDGSPVNGIQRWSVSVGGNGSLSLYETFKSIFFATESDFRIIGLVVYPGKVTVQSNAASIGAVEDLLNYSYPALPADLYNFTLPKKALNVLIYDFHQSDIGKVPELNVSNKVTARKHLERSGLEGLLDNR